jgi:hypothetical protein
VLPNVAFREVDEQTLKAVLAVTLTPQQEPYVGSVAEALAEAREVPEGKPWFRAVFDGELVMSTLMAKSSLRSSFDRRERPCHIYSKA